MDISRYTEKAQQGLASCPEVGLRFNHQQIDDEHLLLAHSRSGEGAGRGHPEQGRRLARRGNGPRPAGTGKVAAHHGAGGAPDRFYLSGRMNKLLANAEDEAKQLKDEFISVEHLLLAMTDDKGAAGTILKEFGVTRDRLLSTLKEVRGNQRVTTQNPEETYQSLEKFGRDLTQYARLGKLDPVIGRDEEIRRVIQVLSRRTKNNPV